MIQLSTFEYYLQIAQNQMLTKLKASFPLSPEHRELPSRP